MSRYLLKPTDREERREQYWPLPRQTLAETCAGSSSLIDRWTNQPLLQLPPPRVQKETLRKASPHFPNHTIKTSPIPVHGSGPGEQGDR